MKIYKTYFDKNDTPFKPEIQRKKKYHTIWYRQPYTMFLNHEVVKIKLFGLITIYKKEIENEESICK